MAIGALKYSSQVVVVDDACPDNSGQAVLGVHDSITVLFRAENGGVGAATKTGVREAQRLGADIIVKLDADGQMNPNLIPQLIEPLISGEVDFRKGTRFDSPEDLEGMPRVRLIGNSFLSLINKFSSGYWTVNDPTNGFLALSKETHKSLNWDKISNGYFFESDLLFRARLIGTRISQMRMKSVYSEEISSLKPLQMVIPFASKHLRNQVKRIAYMYFVREWNLGTIYLMAGLVSLGVGIGASVNALLVQTGYPIFTGTAVLASLGYVLWVQFSTAFLTVDVASEPN